MDEGLSENGTGIGIEAEWSEVGLRRMGVMVRRHGSAGALVMEWLLVGLVLTGVLGCFGCGEESGKAERAGFCGRVRVRGVLCDGFACVWWLRKRRWAGSLGRQKGDCGELDGGEC